MKFLQIFRNLVFAFSAQDLVSFHHASLFNNRLGTEESQEWGLSGRVQGVGLMIWVNLRPLLSLAPSAPSAPLWRVQMKTTLYNTRSYGELRLSRLSRNDKIYAKNCVLKFFTSAASCISFTGSWGKTPFSFLIAASTWNHGPK